jgi:hypothetical protein
MIPMIRTMLSGFLMVGLPLVAAGDTTLKYDDGGNMTRLVIADGKVRLDDAREKHWMLFDSRRRVMILVDPEKREFTEMDEATLESLHATVDAVMTRMETELARLPPEMQAQMRQMMGDSLPGGGAARRMRLESTGRVSGAAGHRCDVIRVMVDERVESEVCLAPASELGLPATDAAVVAEWQSFARSLAEKASRFVSLDAEIFGDGGQLPVIYDHPGSERRGVLTGVGLDPVDAGLLQVPDGYSENRMEAPLP